jgi:O-antigen/teichoic acid export membrane protein
MLPVTAYGVFAGLCIKWGAPVLPWIFGSDFEHSSSIIVWLAFIPGVIGISQIGLNVLTSLECQRIRVVIEFAGLFANIISNVYMIPARGAEGAAISMLASQALISLLCIVSMLVLRGSRQGVNA